MQTFLVILLIIHIILSLIFFCRAILIHYLNSNEGKQLKRFDELSYKLFDLEFENKSINSLLMTIDFDKDLEPWFIEKLITLNDKIDEFNRFEKDYKKLKIINEFLLLKRFPL